MSIAILQLRANVTRRSLDLDSGKADVRPDASRKLQFG